MDFQNSFIRLLLIKKIVLHLQRSCIQKKNHPSVFWGLSKVRIVSSVSETRTCMQEVKKKNITYVNI